MKLGFKIFLLSVIIVFFFVQFKSITKFPIFPIQEINYETHIKPIIENHCLSCHAGKRPKARLDLSTYDNLKSAIENKGLLERINDPKKPMPKDGLISETERVIVSKWVKNNYKKEG